jgi:hypothetical protein
VPLTLADKQEIIELVWKYNYCNDHFDAEGWAELFTEDGVLRHGEVVDARGRLELVEHIGRRRRAEKPRLRLFSDNFNISGEADRASLRCYVLAFEITESLGPPKVIAEYDDTLVRVDGRWKFAERNVTVVAGTRTWPHYGAKDPNQHLSYSTRDDQNN